MPANRTMQHAPFRSLVIFNYTNNEFLAQPIFDSIRRIRAVQRRHGANVPPGRDIACAAFHQMDRNGASPRIQCLGLGFRTRRSRYLAGSSAGPSEGLSHRGIFTTATRPIASQCKAPHSPDQHRSELLEDWISRRSQACPWIILEQARRTSKRR